MFDNSVLYSTFVYTGTSAGTVTGTSADTVTGAGTVTGVSVI